MARKAPKLVEDFIIPSLNNRKYEDKLMWDRSEPDVFLLRWIHKSGTMWSAEDTVVFQDWDKMKGHFKPENPEYFTNSKQRFRSALYKLQNVKELDSIYCSNRVYYKKYKILKVGSPKRCGRITKPTIRKRRKEFAAEQEVPMTDKSYPSSPCSDSSGSLIYESFPLEKFSNSGTMIDIADTTYNENNAHFMENFIQNITQTLCIAQTNNGLICSGINVLPTIQQPCFIDGSWLEANSTVNMSVFKHEHVSNILKQSSATENSNIKITTNNLNYPVQTLGQENIDNSGIESFYNQNVFEKFNSSMNPEAPQKMESSVLEQEPKNYLPPNFLNPDMLLNDILSNYNFENAEDS